MAALLKIACLTLLTSTIIWGQADNLNGSEWLRDAYTAWNNEDDAGLKLVTEKAHLAAAQGGSLALDSLRQNVLIFAGDLYAGGHYHKGREILMISDSIVSGVIFNHLDSLGIEVTYQIALGSYFLYDSKKSISYLQDIIPQLDSTSFDFARCQSLLGFSYIDLGLFSRAIKPLELAYPGYVEFYGTNSDKVASNRNDLGLAYEMVGLINRAETLYRQGLEIRGLTDGKRSPDLYPLLINLADLYRKKNNHSESQKFFQRAVDLVEGQEEIDSAALNVLYLNLGILLFEKGDLQESRAILDLALDGFQREDTPQAIERQGMVYLQRAKREAYVENYEESISILENAQSLLASLDQQKFRETCNQVASNLGVYHNRAGNYDAALTYLYSLRDSLVEDPDGQDLLANVYNEIAESYRGLGNESEAERFARLALAKQIELYGYPDFHQAFTYNQLAKLAAERGTPNTRVLALVDSALLMNGAENLPLEGYLDYEFYLESLLLKAKHSTGARALEIYARANDVLANLRTRLISAEDKLNFAKYSYQISSQAIARRRS
jgi:Tfp pilus assembly protein PilF